MRELGRIGPRQLSELGALANLESVTFIDVDDRAIDWAIGQPKLTSLSFRDEKLSAEKLREMAEGMEVLELELHDCPLSPSVIESIGQMESLERLLVENLQGVEAVHALEVLCRLRYLKELSLWGAPEELEQELAKVVEKIQRALPDCDIQTNVVYPRAFNASPAAKEL